VCHGPLDLAGYPVDPGGMRGIVIAGWGAALAVLVAIAGSGACAQCEHPPADCLGGDERVDYLSPPSTACPSPDRICYTNEACGATIVCECVGDKCAPCSADSDCPTGQACQRAIPGGAGQSDIPSHCG
jgi:Cys-rich repeat protein